MTLLPASIAEASAETPILRLYREWLATYASFTGATDEEADALYPQITAIEHRIEAAPVTCLEDLAANAIATTGAGDFGLPKPVVAECRALLGNALGEASAPLPVPTADPLPGLLAEHERHEANWLAAPEGSPEAEAAWEAFGRAEEAMETTVATSAEGIAAQIAYMKASYGSGLAEDLPGPPMVYDVPHAFLDVILAGVRRVAP